MNRRALGLLAFAAVTALSLPAQAVAAPGGGGGGGSNALLASGTVVEDLGGGGRDWTISFDIHKKSAGNSSLVSITQGTGGSTSTFSATVCTGSYTDPVRGGTTVYAVGPVISGNLIYGSPYEAFIVHKGGPLGADYSWSVPANLPNLAAATDSTNAAAGPSVGRPGAGPGHQRLPDGLPEFVGEALSALPHLN